MNESALRLSRRGNLLLFGFTGLFLWIVVSIGLDLFLGGRQFVQAFLEKCLARCSALMTLSFSAAEGVRLFLFLSLLALFLMAMVESLRDSRRVRKFTLSLHKMEIPPRLGGLIHECGLRSDRVVVFPSGLSFACTAGLFSPRIYISTQLLDSLGDEEVKAVLRHEQSHSQRRDPLRGMLLGLLSRFFLFVPHAARLLRRVKREMEFVADGRSLAFAHSPAFMASALVKVSLDNRACIRIMTGFAEEDFLEERLNRLLNLKMGTAAVTRLRPRTLVQTAAGLLLALSLGLLILPVGNAFPKSSPWVCRHSSHEACCPSGGEGTSHAHCRTGMMRLTKADILDHKILEEK
jgi:Zn-dependent protease with chaperone function